MIVGLKINPYMKKPVSQVDLTDMKLDDSARRNIHESIQTCI